MNKPVIVTASREPIDPPAYLQSFLCSPKHPTALDQHTILSADQRVLLTVAVQIKENAPSGKVTDPDGTYSISPQIFNPTFKGFNYLSISFLAFLHGDSGLQTTTFNRDNFVKHGWRECSAQSHYLTGLRFSKDNASGVGGIKEIFFRCITGKDRSADPEIYPLNMLLRREVVNGADQWSLHRLKL